MAIGGISTDIAQWDHEVTLEREHVYARGDSKVTG